MAASPSASVNGRLCDIRPILTWFFDSPLTLCPFSVHRMALAGKELGKDIGQWFGPSTRRCDQVRGCYHRCRTYVDTSFRSLVQSFPEASLGISVAVDGQIFQMDVYLASHPPTQSHCPCKLSRWGGRAVVMLIGIRLGMDGVFTSNHCSFFSTTTKYRLRQHM